MSVAILFITIVLLVFGSAFLSGRRLGVLALGLSTGSVLSMIWSDNLAKLLQDYSIGLELLSPGAMAVGLLILTPLVALLLSGPKYVTKRSRIISAMVIGVLTAAFLVQPLGKYMVLDGDTLAVYRLLDSYWQYVVTVGLVLGLLDLFSMHTKRAKKE